MSGEALEIMSNLNSKLVFIKVFNTSSAPSVHLACEANPNLERMKLMKPDKFNIIVVFFVLNSSQRVCGKYATLLVQKKCLSITIFHNQDQKLLREKYVFDNKNHDRRYVLFTLTRHDRTKMYALYLYWEEKTKKGDSEHIKKRKEKKN